MHLYIKKMKKGVREPQQKKNKPTVPHIINLLSVPYEIKHNWQDSTEPWRCSIYSSIEIQKSRTRRHQEQTEKTHQLSSSEPICKIINLSFDMQLGSSRALKIIIKSCYKFASNIVSANYTHEVIKFSNIAYAQNYNCSAQYLQFVLLLIAIN